MHIFWHYIPHPHLYWSSLQSKTFDSRTALWCQWRNELWGVPAGYAQSRYRRCWLILKIWEWETLTQACIYTTLGQFPQTDMQRKSAVHRDDRHVLHVPQLSSTLLGKGSERLSMLSNFVQALETIAILTCSRRFISFMRYELSQQS